MKAVLLAAGFGTRLKPLTDKVPKCLVPINGQPLLGIWLQMLSSSPQITEIFINTHYLHEQVDDYLSQHWSHLSNLTCWYEPELLGTAGTLINHSAALEDDDVLVIHADNLSFFDLDAFINSFTRRPSHCDMSMMLFATDTPSSCGIVELNGETVIAMHEKVAHPPGNLANGAVYILSAGTLKWLADTRFTDISTEVIPHLLGKISAWTNTTYHRDIGNPQSYAAAQTESRMWLENSL
ncbi:MAG: nucleotidyltransferase family protein [Gammaproteobacteria bacterium]|nr:nucleotidyltransferase family protein [Gammaproteobacteria bacterium]